jgi:hypothetical protein
MFGRVFGAAGRGQHLHLGAMGAQLVTNHSGTDFVVVARRVDGGNAHQSRGEIDDLVARPIDLGHDMIDGSGPHTVNPI